MSVGEKRPQEWIINMLMRSTSSTPTALMEEVMADERCPTFGPIHHFIVGATLLTCWRNAEDFLSVAALQSETIKTVTAEESTGLTFKGKKFQVLG